LLDLVLFAITRNQHEDEFTDESLVCKLMSDFKSQTYLKEERPS